MNANIRSTTADISLISIDNGFLGSDDDTDWQFELSNPQINPPISTYINNKGIDTSYPMIPQGPGWLFNGDALADAMGSKQSVTEDRASGHQKVWWTQRFSHLRY